MTYRPAHQSQFKRPDGTPWGTKFDSANCWAATSAEGTDFATEGTVKPDPPSFRVASGNLTRGPGWLSDIVAGAEKLGLSYGVADPFKPSITTYVGITWDRVLAKLDKENLALVIATDYDQVPDSKSCAPNFNDGHSMIFFGGTKSAPDSHGVQTISGDDPLCNSRKQYPLHVIEAAAKKWGKGQGLAPGTVFVSQFRQASPVPPPPPPPPPPPDPETDAEKIARLTTERDKALADLQAATDALALAIAAAEAKDATLEDWAVYGASVRALPVPGETP